LSYPRKKSQKWLPAGSSGSELLPDADGFVHVADPAVQFVKVDALIEPFCEIVSMKESIKRRPLGRAQPVRYAGTAPNVIVKLQKIR
jgi:hypothetical protein